MRIQIKMPEVHAPATTQWAQQKEDTMDYFEVTPVPTERCWLQDNGAKRAYPWAIMLNEPDTSSRRHRFGELLARLRGGFSIGISLHVVGPKSLQKQLECNACRMNYNDLLRGGVAYLRRVALLLLRQHARYMNEQLGHEALHRLSPFFELWSDKAGMVGVALWASRGVLVPDAPTPLLHRVAPRGFSDSYSFVASPARSRVFFPSPHPLARLELPDTPGGICSPVDLARVAVPPGGVGQSEWGLFYINCYGGLEQVCVRVLSRRVVRQAPEGEGIPMARGALNSTTYDPSSVRTVWRVEVPFPVDLGYVPFLDMLTADFVWWHGRAVRVLTEEVTVEQEGLLQRYEVEFETDGFSE